MKWFLIVSDLLIPMIILGILCYGILQQVAVYDVFVKGAKSGFLTVAKIIPTMVGLMVAVGILRASGLLLVCRKKSESLQNGLAFRANWCRLQL